MTEQRTWVNTDSDRRPGLGRRVKRGLIASYVHGISVRHRAGDVEEKPAEDLVAPSRAAD